MSALKLVFSSLVFLVFISCSSERVSSLQTEIDSLNTEISLRNKLFLVMNNRSGVLDSLYYATGPDFIGTGNDDSQERIQQLIESIKSSEMDLNQVRGMLTKSENEALAYHLMVMALQDEVTIRDREIITANAKTDNNKIAYEGSLNKKDRELARLQSIVDEMKKMDLANAYFEKALKLEEKARRIIFAPKKKKENLKEALELYKNSYALGKAEAAQKIEKLSRAL